MPHQTDHTTLHHEAYLETASDAVGNAVGVNRDAEQRRAQRDLVRSGYDAISMAYRDNRGRANPSSPEDTAAYKAWLDELAGLLPDAARVLDLGCGAGVPTSRVLVDLGFEVTGLDISEGTSNHTLVLAQTN